MKVGIFGGAFDPVHSEHLNIAKVALEELDLDRLLIVPTSDPPHKKGATASFPDRYEMAKLVFSFDDRIEVSDIETRLPDGYSTTLVEAIRSEYDGAETVFIMGGDSLRDFLTWHEPETLISMTEFALVRRDGAAYFDESLANLTSSYGMRATVLPYNGREISSSVLQAELELNGSSPDVPAEAMEYIFSHNLYSDYSEFLARVRADMSEKTFAHVSRTCLYAMRFRSVLRLTFEEVFLATVLHDIAKHRPLPEMIGVPAPVVHQYEGAKVAATEYGIADENILSAIRTHTTGDENMTSLQKLVYLADTLEPARDYPGVEELRKAVEEDFERGFVRVVRHTYDHLKESGGEIDALTEKCLEYYKHNQ